MNTLTRFKEGDPLNIPVGAYNAFCDVAEFHMRQGRRTGTPPGEGAAGNQVLTIRVKNNTGEDLEAFEAFTADHSMSGQSGQLTIDGNEYAVSDSPIVCIGQADKEDGAPHLLILQEAIPDGEFGRAVTRGICIAKVDITNSSHHYADLPVSGSVLRSGYGGRVRILQVESASTGEQYCLVDLLQSPISDPIVTITGGPTDGLYTGFYVQRSETSPYSYVSTANEVRVIPISGGTLQTGRNYLGRTVGQVTISTVVYDLVDVVGDANYTTTNGSGHETAWAGGLVNTTTQSFRGNKYFRNNVYSQDTAVYSTAYSQLSPNGAIACTSGSYLGSTVNSFAVSTTGTRPEIDLSHNNGTYTVTGGVTFTEIDGFGAGGYLYLESSADRVIVDENLGIMRSGTIHLGLDQVINIYENTSPLGNLHTLTFKGGLLTAYAFTP